MKNKTLYFIIAVLSLAVLCLSLDVLRRVDKSFDKMNSIGINNQIIMERMLILSDQNRTIQLSIEDINSIFARAINDTITTN